MEKGKKYTKPEWSWIMYDWANSVYATNIMAAIFPIYFAAIAPDGDMWWGYGTSIATLIVAFLAPILGAIADYNGMKKKLFTIFLMIGVVFTLTMAFFGPWQWVLIGYILSYIGFCGSCLFYDSFLTDVTTVDRMDKVSSMGYAMGYIGGSTIPFIVSIGFVMTIGNTDMPLAIKLSVALTSVWWLLFTIPFLRDVKQVHSLGEVPKKLASSAFKNIVSTFKEIVKHKGILLFILAYFFYIDGVGTVIHMSTAYGTTLGLDATGMIIALLVTQLVAVPFSILFSKIAEKIGSITMLTIAVGIYIIICITGFYMGYSLEIAAPADYESALKLSNILFWCLAVLVGTCQGGIQALSRSYFGKVIPPKKSSEFFGFFDIFGKFAAVIGPFLYASIKGITGQSSYGILSLILLFLIAGVILIAGRREFKKAEAANITEE